jgi:CBS domain-containing protein
LILGPDFDLPPESELTVRDVYIADPYIVDLNEPLDHVLLTMAQKHIGSVLVTKNGKLAGLFTTTDACRCFGEFLREKFSPRGDDEAA